MDVHRPLSERTAPSAAALAIGLSLIACGSSKAEPPKPTCAQAASDGEALRRAVAICNEEYSASHDPDTGALFASVLRRSEQFDDAAKLATELLSTRARAKALQVLGAVAIKRDKNFDEARARYQEAHQLHVAANQMKEAAVDSQQIAVTFRWQHRYSEALGPLDACIAEAVAAVDPVVEGYCHLTANEMLGEAGYSKGAEAEFENADRMLTSDRDRASLEVQHGAFYQNYGFGPTRLNHNNLAVAAYTSALGHATAAGLTRVRRQAELNLAFSLAELERTDDAARHLRTAEQLDANNEDGDEREPIRARIAYRSGDLKRASEIAATAYDRLHAAKQPDLDQLLRLSVMQAEIAIATHDLSGAELWATRGIEAAEAIRAAQTALELRPWMLSLRRQPHELLFTALVRARRFEDALIAFDRWQGRTLLDAMARTKAPATLHEATIHSAALREKLPVLSAAPLTQPVDRKILLAAIREVDLVAVLVANDHVWRITARHGDLDIADLGAVAALKPELDRFAANPAGQPTLAEALGARLLGAAAFRTKDETLFVLLDGPVASIPVAALRANGQPLATVRRIVRAPRLSELGCVAPRTRPRHAVVVADADGSLLLAREEAKQTARMLHAEAQLGDAATSTAVLAASGDDLLHVAVHGSIGSGGGALALHDKALSALEICARNASPELVVLSVCDSAAADDGELSTSLATAFVASGSKQVIATLRPVTDKGAAQITHAFYRYGGATDPARALAQLQKELAAKTEPKDLNPDWPNFVLFGHDICRKESP